jgi:hypothetical protein
VAAKSPSRSPSAYARPVGFPAYPFPRRRECDPRGNTRGNLEPAGGDGFAGRGPALERLVVERVDPGSSSGGILGRHGSDEIAKLTGDFRSTWPKARLMCRPG